MKNIFKIIILSLILFTLISCEVKKSDFQINNISLSLPEKWELINTTSTKANLKIPNERYDVHLLMEVTALKTTPVKSGNQPMSYYGDDKRRVYKDEGNNTSFDINSCRNFLKCYSLEMKNKWYSVNFNIQSNEMPPPTDPYGFWAPEVDIDINDLVMLLSTAKFVENTKE